MIQFIPNSIQQPPDITHINKVQEVFFFTFPDDYLHFLKSYNGGKPVGLCVFETSMGVWVVERFLPLLSDIDVDVGMYDIAVVTSQIAEYLVSNPDTDDQIVRIPIAALFAGDFVCLDFSTNPASICIWDHNRSAVFSPCTYPVATSFSKFLDMLRIDNK
jgi:hypothetical protein